MTAKKLLNEILTGERGLWEGPRHWQCPSPRTWAADFESIVAPYSPTYSHSETLKDIESSSNGIIITEINYHSNQLFAAISFKKHTINKGNKLRIY